MPSGSRFIVAAVAALAVSAASVGFLAARWTNNIEPAVSASLLAERTPASVAAPVPSPEVKPVEPQPSAPTRHFEALATRTGAPKPRARTAPNTSAPQHVPSPAAEPVVKSRAATAAAPPSAKSPVVDVVPATPPAAVVETPAVEIPRTQVEPARPPLEEYTVTADSVLGIRIDQSLSSATAKLEDRVTASVSRDLIVNGRTVLPAGTRLEGNVTLVQPGSKFKGRARLGIRFYTLVLADGLRVPIQTETLYRDGESATGSTAAKVGGGAGAGAIIGGLLGGKKGALIGAGVGAAGGTAAVMAGDAKDAVIDSGTPLTVRVTSPVTLTIERD